MGLALRPWPDATAVVRFQSCAGADTLPWCDNRRRCGFCLAPAPTPKMEGRTRRTHRAKSPSGPRARSGLAQRGTSNHQENPPRPIHPNAGARIAQSAPTPSSMRDARSPLRTCAQKPTLRQNIHRHLRLCTSPGVVDFRSHTFPTARTVDAPRQGAGRHRAVHHGRVGPKARRLRGRSNNRWSGRRGLRP